MTSSGGPPGVQALVGEGKRAVGPPAKQTVPAAELVGVSKAFGGTQALSDVSFALMPGEVLALVGENGAGKSTCVKMLGGVYHPDSGTVRVAGHDVVVKTPLDAQRMGIAVVNQLPSLFGDLSLAENIFAGRMSRTKLGLIDHSKAAREAKQVLDRLGLDRLPSTQANALRTSEQQMVEIARALSTKAKVVILDEPTASLSAAEVDRLFQVIDELRKEGVALLFVGHRLEEIFRIADRLAVLRDGVLVDTVNAKDTTEADVVRMMVGRDVSDMYPDRTAKLGDETLVLKGICAPTGLRDISLSIRAGEIVGLYGLVGSGRTELARVLFGVDRKTAGTIELGGKEIAVHSPNDAMAKGIAYVSEDRRGQSIVEDFSILDNATLPVINEATRLALIRRRLELALVSGPLERMKLRFSSYDQPVGTLSGGNQQKVVLAKWLATNPRLLILDEATQGIDVAAKADVHRIVSELAEQGLAILLISSDLPEVLGLSDRVLVMRRGHLVGEFKGDEATAERVAGLAASTTIDQEPEAMPAEDTPLVKPAIAEQKRLARAVAPPPAPPASVKSEGSIISRLIRRREMGLLAVLVVLVVSIMVINPRFASAANLSNLSDQAALIGFVAAGELMVVLTRNIDISVGSVIGLTAFVFGDFVKMHPTVPMIVPLLIAVGIGLACGLFNGAVVAFGRVPSIVVTLGTMYVYRGIDAILSNGKEVSPGSIPQSMQNIIATKVIGISMLVWLCVLLFIIVGIILRWTKAGREFYRIGSNPSGAELIGVKTKQRLFTAFATSGSLAGLAGVFWALNYGIIDGQSAYGQEMTVVAVVVVGGVALRGGSGNIVGVALGAMVLFTIQDVLVLANVNSYALQAFYGAAIIIAVGLDVLIMRRNTRHVEVT